MPVLPVCFHPFQFKILFSPFQIHFKIQSVLRVKYKCNNTNVTDSQHCYKYTFFFS